MCSADRQTRPSTAWFGSRDQSWRFRLVSVQLWVSMNDNNRLLEVLLEDISDKLTSLSEGMGSVLETVHQLDQRLEKVETSTELLPAIKAAVTDQSRHLRDLEHATEDHDRRIGSLEQAA